MCGTGTKRKILAGPEPGPKKVGPAHLYSEKVFIDFSQVPTGEEVKDYVL